MSDEYKKEKGWDQNVITPGESAVEESARPLLNPFHLLGTPFMDLLAISLRYWVAQKMNTDPGWAKVRLVSLLRYEAGGSSSFRPASSDNIRCLRSGRGRAQDYGFHPSAA
jgi:hypothetical protein